MLRYTMIRMVWIFIVLFTVLTLNFTLLKLAPEYPPTVPEERELYYNRQVRDGFMTSETIRDPEIVDQIRDPDSGYERCDGCIYLYNARNHLYQVYIPVPIFQQYLAWLTNILTDWNWGYSTRVRPNVSAYEIMAPRIAVTMKLNLMALIFYIPIGFTLGIIAALKKNSVTDNVISLGVMLFISIPSFVIMLFLIMVFGFELGWVPTQFPPRFGADGTPLPFFHTGLILPIFGLSVGSIAGLTRLTRAELTEVLTSEFLLLARTKGLTRPQAVVRHAMRNSMVPLVPSIIGSFVGLLSGSVIIEIIYRVPGTSRVFLDAMRPNSLDYNLILAVTAFYTIIGLFAVLLVDLSYGVVDPRIRMGAKK